MAERWIDVSIPMGPGMTVWPGDPDFELRPSERIALGDGVNVSVLVCSTHTGTHVDAPWHFEDHGPRLDEVPHDVFFGEALVLDLDCEGPITAAHLGDRSLPPRVLFRTRNSQLPDRAGFVRDYVALAPDAAARLVADRVRLAGVDYLSVAPFKQPGQETHHTLLRAGVLVVEGLRLRQVPAGVCQFVVLPLALAGADGSPCRAFVGLEEPP